MNRLNKIVMALVTTGMFVSGAAQASLNDRGGGLLYDDVLNVTWLQDANYAKSSGYSATGRMTWSQAMTWADTLVYHDSVRNVDYNDWRLPSTAPMNGVAFDYSYGKNSDIGWNVSASGTTYVGSTGSEMANLYYGTLGNKAYADPITGQPQTGWGLVNTGPFHDLQPSVYWSGTDFTLIPNNANAWFFDNTSGYQGYYGKDVTNYALAVRFGDVAAVPEPESYMLLLVGLGLLSGVRKRWLE